MIIEVTAQKFYLKKKVHIIIKPIHSSLRSESKIIKLQFYTFIKRPFKSSPEGKDTSSPPP